MDNDRRPVGEAERAQVPGEAYARDRAAARGVALDYPGLGGHSRRDRQSDTVMATPITSSGSETTSTAD